MFKFLKDDASPVSIFSLSGSDAQGGHLVATHNGVKRLRTVRHLNMLSFLHSAEIETIDSGSSKVIICIVTKPVMLLSEKIKELGLEATLRQIQQMLLRVGAWESHQFQEMQVYLDGL